jgi:acetyl esterase/lipase
VGDEHDPEKWEPVFGKDHAPPKGLAMSVRAELMRVLLRHAVRPRVHAQASVPLVRKRMALLARLIPRPPRGTLTEAIDAGGVPAARIVTPASRADRDIIYLHGGGYLFGSPPIYRDMTWRIAAGTRACVVCVDYRLAPEHPFPAALDDAVAAYRWLLAQGAEPRRVALMGDSAGGGLMFAALMRLRDEGTPLPAVAAAVSPWTDLALTGASFRANTRDPLIPVEHAERAVALYLAGADARNPYASPLYGDAAGLPPSLILVGGDEVLRDDAVRMAERLQAAGCDVTLDVFPRMFHAWHMLVRVLPEAKTAVARACAFVDERL